MKNNRKARARDFVGKTIKNIDKCAVNYWKINFTDGTKIGLEAKIEGPLGIPALALDVYEGD